MSCIYATLFFSLFERTVILPKYKKNLLLYQRQIDDIFGVWTDDPSTKLSFEDFQRDLNSVTKLQWETEQLSTNVTFLDLTISITNHQTIHTKTYQKPMHLHLYIPPHSAHPPSMIKSLIFGLLLTYWKQNSDGNDFKEMVKLLYKRLLNRGHQ